MATVATETSQNETDPEDGVSYASTSFNKTKKKTVNVSFSTKICNREFEDLPTCPVVPARTLRRSEPQTSKGPPKHRNPRRTTAGTTATPAEKSRGESQGSHPAATMQKPQGAAATSPQAPPATVHARADPAMDPETQDPGTHHPPKQRPDRAQGARTRQAATGSEPAPDTENPKYTSGQRLQPPAGSMAGRK
ncbi:hypothetical protein ATANTOWER_019950 [Ataeniobius toweri]|uniref:Uncharacterized protein n=1 Tax=Ataeniobius toweri TaxID=208326 RepID=A0ABU7AR72_9TELE|nr:hypothetical protein [Ataeniobius toweri]